MQYTWHDQQKKHAKNQPAFPCISYIPKNRPIVTYPLPPQKKQPFWVDDGSTPPSPAFRGRWINHPGRWILWFSWWMCKGEATFYHCQNLTISAYPSIYLSICLSYLSVLSVLSVCLTKFNLPTYCAHIVIYSQWHQNQNMNVIRKSFQYPSDYFQPISIVKCNPHLRINLPSGKLT